MTEPFRVEVPGSNRGNEAVLSSDWTGLSPHLIASFYPVERIGDQQFSIWPNGSKLRV